MKNDDVARLERKKSKHSVFWFFPPHWLFPGVAPGIISSNVQVLFNISLKKNFFLRFSNDNMP